MEEAFLRGNESIAIDVAAGARAHLRYFDVSGTVAVPGTGCESGGINLQIGSGTQVELDEFTLTAAGMGLAINGGYLSADSGEITGNEIGLLLSAPDDASYDFLTCIGDVFVYDNGIDFFHDETAAPVVGELIEGFSGAEETADESVFECPAVAFELTSTNVCD